MKASLDRRGGGQRSVPDLQANILHDGSMYRRLPSRRRRAQLSLSHCLWLGALILCASSIFFFTSSAARPSSTQILPESGATDLVLISYSYFEKDMVQKANAEFFIEVGMGIHSKFDTPQGIQSVFVVNGEQCSPCAAFQDSVSPVKIPTSLQWSISSAEIGQGITLLRRTINEGMDFAAHNVTLQWLQHRKTYSRYKFFIFLNSSVRGPFYPSYMPKDWQWTRAYTDKLEGNIHGVSSSIVCLPEVDAGGFGPKMESWAFALTHQGLDVAVSRGVFWQRACKLCVDDSGIVVQGEYGLTKALFDAGFGISTLMSKYQKGVDWRLSEHWNCNNNVHPSRHGTYDDISMHPFEVAFLKASWDVGQPHLKQYTKWMTQHAQGLPGTEGKFDEPLYRFAISPEAQEPNLASECFTIPREAIE